MKHSLLALLIDGPRYGAALRAEFGARTGNTWPLNVGQVYTTLNRLERDGLVVSGGERDAEDQTISYSLTDAGRAEVETWWMSPVDRSTSSRDQLAIKLAMAVTVPGVDLTRLVQVQRSATIARLQELTRLKRTTMPHSRATSIVTGSGSKVASAAARRSSRRACLRRGVGAPGIPAPGRHRRGGGLAGPAVPLGLPVLLLPRPRHRLRHRL
ncbi:MAG: helix-turn-helix transcriptional regulator [Actinobacteria bacterium]|nr:helix-turn-helix transcriptional regulator [Actinomycetota bacterium]